MSGRRAFLTGTTKLLACLVSFLTVSTFFAGVNSGFWELEILANLKGFLLFGHILIIIFAGVFKSRPKIYLITLQAALAFYILSNLWPLYGKASRTDSSKQDGSFLFANLSGNYSDDVLQAASLKLKEEITKNKHDGMVLLGFNSSWKERLGFLNEEFKNHLEKVSEDCYGAAFYADKPISDPIVESLGEDLPPAYLLKVGEGGDSILIGAIHTAPPLSARLLYQKRLQLRRFSTLLRFENEPALVYTALYATPFSAYFRSFRQWAELKHADEGSPAFLSSGLSLNHTFYRALSISSEELEIGLNFPVNKVTFY